MYTEVSTDYKVPVVVVMAVSGVTASSARTTVAQRSSTESHAHM
jgi:hypothetical protein